MIPAEADINSGTLTEAKAFAARFGSEMQRLQPYIERGIELGGNKEFLEILGMQATHIGATLRERFNAEREYMSLYEFVLREGRPYTPPERPRPQGMRKKANKMCFRNAWYTVWWQDVDQYVEGFAQSVSGIAFPMHHAWVSTPDGVIEPTWKTSGHAYFGLPFSHETVSLVMRASGTFSVLEDTRNNFPILDRPWNEAEFQQRMRDILAAQVNRKDHT